MTSLWSIAALLLFCFSLSPPARVRAQSGTSACDCGYKDPQDPTGQIWTTYWESDFTQMSIADLHRDFYLMDYSYYHDGGTASRAFEPNNVAIDQKGLHLSVQTETVDKKVPSAGLYTRSQDFGFGAYHFEVQATNVPGTVQALYMYRNNKNEIDIESVGPNGTNPVVNFSVKPQLYSPNGAASPATKSHVQPGYDLTTDFHAYSFVWNSTCVIYAVDGVWDTAITTNVPPLPGMISLSHWSDGNPRFSGGPPTSPATIHIASIKAFYNATGALLTCKTASAPCNGAEALGGSKRNEKIPARHSKSHLSRSF